MNNLRNEFEDLRKENRRLKNATVLMVAILTSGFWLFELVNFFSDGPSNRDFTELYILSGGTVTLGIVVHLFAKSSKIGWFFFSLIISFLLGLFTNTVFEIDIDFHENPEAWRDGLMLIMSLSTLATFILLIHVKTKRSLSISNVMYITCICLCSLVLILTYLLIS